MNHFLIIIVAVFAQLAVSCGFAESVHHRGTDTLSQIWCARVASENKWSSNLIWKGLGQNN